MFKNVMVALGLGPDEEYDDRYFDDDAVEMDDLELDDRAMAPQQSRSISDTPDPSPSPRSTGTVGAVRPIRSVPADDDPTFSVRPITRTTDEPAAGVVPVVASKPRSVAPQSFGDAKVIADEFKRSTPVIMQLTDVDRDLARRLIDFASGVCYSLGGSMEKLATNVFLLLPKGTEVSADDRRRIEERGYDR
jgi:cell division inhibitor SepF